MSTSPSRALVLGLAAELPELRGRPASPPAWLRRLGVAF